MIEVYKTYRARIKYHRTDDLLPDSLPDGTEITVRALFKSDENDRYPGQWTFEVDGSEYWLPECDLEILAAD